MTRKPSPTIPKPTLSVNNSRSPSRTPSTVYLKNRKHIRMEGSSVGLIKATVGMLKAIAKILLEFGDVSNARD